MSSTDLKEKRDGGLGVSLHTHVKGFVKFHLDVLDLCRPLISEVGFGKCFNMKTIALIGLCISLPLIVSHVFEDRT